jgi:hypothetical protein
MTNFMNKIFAGRWLPKVRPESTRRKITSAALALGRMGSPPKARIKLKYVYGVRASQRLLRVVVGLGYAADLDDVDAGPSDLHYELAHRMFEVEGVVHVSSIRTRTCSEPSKMCLRRQVSFLWLCGLVFAIIM